MAWSKQRVGIVLVLGAIAAAAFGWVFRASLRPFLPYRHEMKFSIAIYGGPSPVELAPIPGTPVPVLSAADVTDISAAFVADPFLLRHDDRWWVFFEVWNELTSQGDLAVASSDDARRWHYDGVVLDEPFHLSYPYVFELDGAVYMVPESAEASPLRLYRAVDFPRRWQLDTELAKGVHIDPSLFEFGGKWWLFSGPRHENDELSLFYSDALRGPWQPHPNNPIVRGDPHIARPGGRVLVLDGKPIRFGQDCFPNYGRAVSAFVVDELTPTTYHEHLARPTPILHASGVGWNMAGMHQIDAHRLDDGTWLAAVDGYYFQRMLGFR